MSRCVQDKLSLLPESLRSVIIFADIMDFSHQEMADILGLTVENVKVRLHRARKKFKAILEKECTFEVDERSVLVCEPIDKTNGGDFYVCLWRRLEWLSLVVAHSHRHDDIVLHHDAPRWGLHDRAQQVQGIGQRDSGPPVCLRGDWQRRIRRKEKAFKSIKGYLS